MCAIQYYTEMGKLNFSFISPSRRSKCFFATVSSVVLTFILAYLYVYELIDVIPENDIFSYLVPVDTSSLRNVCPFTQFTKSQFRFLRPDSHLFENNASLWAQKLNISAGGEWQPQECAARFLVAIVIPYRNRENNLKEFIQYIHPFVQQQNIHYRIYLIEQSGQKKFNKGTILNAGFIEVLKDKQFPCFIFHDIDMLPENLNNIYACTKNPRHMAAAIDRFDYRPPYYRNFGGVFSMLVDHYRQVNGFSNEFYGWGAEDDDFYNRVRNAGIRPIRFDYDVSRYFSLDHKRAKPNEKRFDIMRDWSRASVRDGLTTARYSVVGRANEPLFTRILVKLKE